MWALKLIQQAESKDVRLIIETLSQGNSSAARKHGIDSDARYSPTRTAAQPADRRALRDVRGSSKPAPPRSQESGTHRRR